MLPKQVRKERYSIQTLKLIDLFNQTLYFNCILLLTVVDSECLDLERPNIVFEQKYINQQ